MRINNTTLSDVTGWGTSISRRFSTLRAGFLAFSDLAGEIGRIEPCRTQAPLEREVERDRHHEGADDDRADELR